MLAALSHFFTGTLRGRLILSVAAVHAVMMALFISDLTMRQRSMLLDRQIEQATALSEALATSGAGWIAADDLSGLQELVEVQRRYPEVSFAILVDGEGRVLADTDRTRRGMYMLDLPREPGLVVISQSPSLVDVAAPAIIGGRHVGWARVGIGQKAWGAKLAVITRNGILYAMAAILIGSVIAWFMGRRITERLYLVQKTIDAIRSGDSGARVLIKGTDEAALMGSEFNGMIDVLAERDAELRASEGQFRRLIQNIQAAVVVHGADTRVLTSNLLAQKLLGLTEEQMLGKTAPDPDWHFIREDGTVMPLEEYPVNRVLSTGRPLRNAVAGVHRHSQTDGDVWVLVHADPVLDEHGTIAQIVVTFFDISARRMAEETLRINETRMRMGQAIGHVGNWEYNVQTTQFWGSDEAKRIYGFDPAQGDFSTDEVENCIPERERVHQALIDLIEVGKPYDLEFEIHPRDNSPPRIIASVAELQRDEHGNPVRVAGVIHDITARKRAEEALHRLNRELRAISECNQALMRAVDEQTLLHNICRIICEDAGYHMAWVGYPEDDEARTIRPVGWAGVEDGYLEQAGITWADSERGRGPSGVAIRTGKSSAIQDFLSDPRALPWRESALERGYRSSISMPLKDETAATFGILTIYSTEPSAFTEDEQRLLEELSADLAFGITVLRARIKRQRAEEGLRLANERFSLAARAAHIGVWDWDIQKNELVWDDGMYELYGVRREDFAGAYEAWLKGIHPDDRMASDEISRQARSGERDYDTEFRVVWPDGSIHHLKAYGQVVRDGDGNPLRMTGINYDITERRQAEAEIRHLNQDLERRVADRTSQLESAVQELETFAYSVSHDLRAPLRNINGMLGMLKKRIGPTLDAESQRYMLTISRAVVRMAALIDDLLSFSRMGRKGLVMSRFDMESLVNEILHDFEPETQGRGINWRVGSLPVVTGDRSMLRIVLVNLISNAVKFTQQRERAEIEIGCAPALSEGEIVIFVRDNGVGFDMQYVDKLFGVFQRLHGADEFEGTGIGLANVRRIIQRHGGRTWAEGKVDGGATFYFSLPHRPEATEPHEAVHAS